MNIGTMQHKPKAEYGQPNKVSVEDMLHEIASQSVAVTVVMEQISKQFESLDKQKIRDATHIFVTGCGDSYFAGIAARLAFHKYGGIMMEPIEALEFGRYVAEYVPPKSIVFAISNSGKATRTVEAALQSRSSGSYTVAITGNEQGWLARESDVVLNQSVKLDGLSLTMPSNLEAEDARDSFGLANFLASLTTLYMLAVYIGEIRGVITESETSVLYEEIAGLAKEIDNTVKICIPQVREYVKLVANQNDFTFIGAGPGYAMALFYAAKSYELARVNGTSQELEEWAHEQFFITDKGTDLLFVAPRGRSYSRALELLETANTMGARTIVVTDDYGLEAKEMADIILPVSGKVSEPFMALPYCVPGELLSALLAEVRGRDAFEFDSELQYIMNMKTIQESELYNSG
jgi:glucosamine--fructose-6-phosphate aminotransferase (isomerizing)